MAAWSPVRYFDVAGIFQESAREFDESERKIDCQRSDLLNCTRASLGQRKTLEGLASGNSRHVLFRYRLQHWRITWHGRDR